VKDTNLFRQWKKEKKKNAHIIGVILRATADEALTELRKLIPGSTITLVVNRALIAYLKKVKSDKKKKAKKKAAKNFSQQ